MRQILQNLGSGETLLAELPAPAPRPGHIRVATQASLVSIGTERMLVGFGKASWLDKARQQPERVKQVLEKVRTDGLVATFQAVKSKLDQPIALGYASAGVVLDVGPGVTAFQPGDRVATNGPHAEVVLVGERLATQVPDGVALEDACYATVASIALQGLRLAEPSLGERVVVMGLGLIGLLAVQLAQAHGCQVLGLDPDPTRVAQAKAMGAQGLVLDASSDPVAAAMDWTAGLGVDAVLITASTSSSEPVRQAAKMSRKRGRIILVGVAGLELDRADFYEKELSFQVSCSYGPGRYDPDYEAKGHDYPAAFVRWTEQRNMQACLELMAQGKLRPSELTTHRVPFDAALKAYAMLDDAQIKPLGLVLDYPGAPDLARSVSLVQDAADGSLKLVATKASQHEPSLPGASAAAQLEGPSDLATPARPWRGVVGPPKVALLGAGNYAGATLLPAMKGSGLQPMAIAAGSGAAAWHLGRRHGFVEVTTETQALFDRPELDLLVVATRHDSHARYATMGLKAGKAVFVEKPLALHQHELDELMAIAEAPGAPPLMVGFNRRFAPMVQKLKGLVQGISAPKALVLTVNAGAIPLNHWTQDVEAGGGRILGEACHFIDLARFLVGHPVTRVQVATMAGSIPHGPLREDKASITLSFADGSLATVHYLANGHKAHPKERIELYVDGKVAVLDNYRQLSAHGFGPTAGMRAWLKQDKGHAAGLMAFAEHLQGRGPLPIPLHELQEVSELSLGASALARAGGGQFER